MPPEPYDREKELAILRESLEDAKMGRVRSFEEFMAELAKEHNLPYSPPPEGRAALQDEDER